MQTITKQVPIEQIPKSWLEGLKDLKGVPVVQVTLEVPSTENSPKIPPERFNELVYQMSKVGRSFRISIWQIPFVLSEMNEKKSCFHVSSHEVRC